MTWHRNDNLERGGKRSATPLWVGTERRRKSHALTRAKAPSPLRFAGALHINVAYRKSLIHECVMGQRRISEADVTQAERAGSRPVTMQQSNRCP